MADCKSNSRKVVKAGIGYTIANYFVKGLAFLTIPIFARLLSTEDYGLYNTYIAYESVLSSFVGLALHMSLKKAIYKFEEQYPAYVSSTALLLLISLAVWEVLALVLFPLYSEVTGLSRFMAALLIVHCFGTSVLSMYNIYLSLSYSYRKYLIVAAVNAIGNIFLSVLLILTLSHKQRYIGRTLGTVIPLVCISCYIIICFWSKAKPKADRTFWKFGLMFSLPLIPHAVSQVILNQFDRIMIKNMVGASESGIYSFAYNIYLIIEVTKISLDSVWGAWFFEKYHNGKYGDINKRSTGYILGMFCFAMVIMLISPELILLLGTKDYFEAKYVVIPICAAGFYSFLYTIPAQVEYYHEKTYYISIGTAFAAALNIALNAVFIRRYGYIAAAYTTEFTYLVYFAIHYVIAGKLVKGSIFDGKWFFAAGIGCFTTSMIGICFLEHWIIRWGVALILGCGLLYIVFRSGVLTKYLKNHNR